MHSPPSAARRISSSIWTAKAGTLFRSGSPTTGRGISLSSGPTSGCKVLRSRGDTGGGALLLGRRRDRRADHSRRLGHGMPTIALGVYGHLFANTDERAAAIMEAAFGAAGI